MRQLVRLTPYLIRANTIYQSDDNEIVVINESQKMEIYKSLSLVFSRNAGWILE